MPHSMRNFVGAYRAGQDKGRISWFIAIIQLCILSMVVLSTQVVLAAHHHAITSYLSTWYTLTITILFGLVISVLFIASQRRELSLSSAILRAVLASTCLLVVLHYV
jgi:sensor c-di-GMP phosphodiesterase-like protein